MLTSLLGFTFPSELQQRRASGVSSQERSAAATQRKSLLLPSAESQTDLLLFDPARQPGRGQQRKSSFFDARHHNMLNTSAGAISVQLMGSGEASPTSPAAVASTAGGTAQRRRMVVGLGFTSVDVLKWMAEDIAMPDLESSNSVVSTGKSSPNTKSRGSITLPAPANPRHATAPPAPAVGVDSQAAAIDDSITSLLPDMGEAAMDGSAPPNPHESVASLMPDLMTDERALVDGSESGSPTKRRSESAAFPEFESQSQVGGSGTPKGALTMLVRYFARAQERTAAAAIKAEDRRRASQGGSRQSDPSSPSSSGVHAVPTGPIVNQSLKKFRAVAVAATIAFKFRAVKLEGSNKQRAKAMASRAIEARDAALRVAFDVAYGGGVRYDRSDLYRKRRVSGFNSSQAGKVLAMRDGSVTVPAQHQQSQQQQQQGQHNHKSAVLRTASPEKPARHDSPDEGALRGPSPPDAASPQARTTTHPPVPASEGPFVFFGGPLADDAGSPSLELSLLSPAKNLGRHNSASIRSAATDRSALQIPPSESVAQHYLDACATLQLPVNRSVLRILATYDEHQYRSKTTAALRKTTSDVSTDHATAAPLRHSFSFSGRSAPPASASQPSWSPSATGLETPADTHVASSPLSIHRGTPPVLSDDDLFCDFSATYCGCNGMVPIVVALERAWALRRLSFAGCGVNDAAVIQLCAVLEASCPKLQHLDLSTNPKIGFAGGSALHNLALSCRKLTSIVLRGTNIRGSTARSIERKLADRKKHPGGATQKSASSLPPMAPSLRRVVSNTRSTASSSLLRRLHVSTKFADDDGSSSSDDDGVVAALPVPTE